MSERAEREHWATVYEAKSPTEVSWYQAAPEPSVYALRRFDASPSAPLIDIGGGASNLVDALLEQGWQDVTVLDIAAPALEASKARLGPRAESVHWEVADITAWHPTRRYGVWHDRAVFHFLTDPAQRQAYRKALSAAVDPGGLVIIATFALDGPERCSGLPVQRYDAATLSAELGNAVQLLGAWREDHVTPWGDRQSFNWCGFRKVG